MLIAVLSSMVISCFILFQDAAAKARRIKEEQVKERLPRCHNWLMGGMRYVCFVSHFKAEAGAEARFLHDSIETVLSSKVYLDSSKLADLRELFSGGVQQSQVLVLLLTKEVLHRAWCLLEVREAIVNKKPLILLQVQGKDFLFADARTFLANLEAHLSSDVIQMLNEYLGEGESVKDLAKTLLDAINAGEPNALQLNLNGTENQIRAQIKDLVEQFGANTSQKPQWALPKQKSSRSKFDAHAVSVSVVSSVTPARSFSERSAGRLSRAMSRGSNLAPVARFSNIMRASATDGSQRHSFYISLGTRSSASVWATKLLSALDDAVKTPSVCPDSAVEVRPGSLLLSTLRVCTLNLEPPTPTCCSPTC